MPYKDKEKQKAAVKRAVDKHRKGITPEGITEQGITQDIETVPASYVQGITGKFKTLPERPRYLTLSDGQVLDRLNQPEGKVSPENVIAMAFCNESYNYRPNESSKETIKALEKAVK